MHSLKSCRTALWRLISQAVALSLCALLFAPFSNARLPSESDQPGEYEVKAAFLFNFTKFVEWPQSAFDDSRAPIVIGILGDDPFGETLQRIVIGQQVQGRDIAIRKERFGENLRRCQMLFISASERAHATQILSAIQNASVLTVSDIDGFAEAGGDIELVIQEKRVHFIVNLDATAQSRLQVSAKLLALARVINHKKVAR